MPLEAMLIEPIHVLIEWAGENGEAVLDALDTSSEPVGQNG